MTWSETTSSILPSLFPPLPFLEMRPHDGKQPSAHTLPRIVRGEDPIPMVHEEGEGENYWMKTAMKAPLVLDRSLPVSSKVLLA